MLIGKRMSLLFGDTREKKLIGLASLISLGVYVIASRGVSLWLSQLDYLTFVLRSFAAKPLLHPIPFQVPISLPQIVTAAVGLIACIAGAVAVKQAFGAHRAAAPLAVLAFLHSIVLPSVIIAVAAWPDGRGKITSLNVAMGQIVLTLVLTYLARSISLRPISDELNHQAIGQTRPDLPAMMVVPLVWLSVIFALVILVAAMLSGIQGYDSFSDHLARPARWLVTGALEPGVNGEVVTFYPGNFELFVRQTLLAGTDQLGFLASFLSSVASVWVIYRIAREVGQGVVTARFSAVAAASLQVLTYQSIVVYSDTFTALCLLLATWLFLIWVRGGASDNYLSLGIGAALGLAMGAKYSAGPPSVVLFLFWTWHASRGALRDQSFDQPLIDVRSLLSQALWLGAGALPAMSFWYLRNFIREGNPLFPLSVAGLPGIPLSTLLAGAPGPASWLDRITYPWVETGHEMGFETGLGPVVAAIVVLAVVFAPWTTERRSLQRLLWWLWLVTLLAWLRTGVLVPRYGLYPLLLAFVFTGSFLTRFSSGLLRLVSFSSVGVTMLGLGYQLLGGAAYHQLLYDPEPPVPHAVQTLPSSRMFNLVGQPAGYFLMGHDYRHQVRSRFLYTSPEDMRHIDVDYILLPSERDKEFINAMNLELVERWSKPNFQAQSLWRVK